VTGSSRSALSDGSWIKPSFSPDSNSLKKLAVPYQNHEQQGTTKEGFTYYYPVDYKTWIIL
jgi:hypothetical protein